MYTCNILTLALFALGMASGRNRQGSDSCLRVTCDVTTKDVSCVDAAARAYHIKWGNGSVNGNSFTFNTKFMLASTKFKCEKDSNTKIDCHKIDDVDCRHLNQQPAPVPLPNKGHGDLLPTNT